ncbi:MAG TPA: aspartyl protease family protein, partial [Mucilaginibacter sp.]|nr:aspartyl protease family protein [Mucilaginibacter sp.]
MLLLCLLSFFAPRAKAQYFDIDGKRKAVTMRFRLIRNLVIIQLKINNKGPFNFILDTGVGFMLITDPAMVDSISLTSKRTIKIAGLGDGDAYEAYVTPPLNIEIPGLNSYDVATTILKNDKFNLSNYVGVPIKGLLGYEFFNNLAVKLDFMDSTLTVYRPHDVRLFRKGSRIPVTVESRKPYMQALVALPNRTVQQCKMVIDLGAGHPISLENMIKKHGLPQKFISANLGVGLAGPIKGFLSRIDEVDIGKYRVKSVITAFPNDYDSTTMKYLSVARDGNLGVGILKRFTVIFDYP